MHALLLLIKGVHIIQIAKPDLALATSFSLFFIIHSFLAAEALGAKFIFKKLSITINNNSKQLILC